MRKILIILILIVGIVSGAVLIASLMIGEKYPPPETLLRSNGMIHHPTYGSYPEVVPFEQGMTLHPGQKAIHTIVIIETEDPNNKDK